MGTIAEFWDRLGYLIFPLHRKKLDNMNKKFLDVRDDLGNALLREDALKQEIGAALVAMDALKRKLEAAELAHQRPPAPQKAKTAAEVRRLMETQGQTEGEDDGV